MRSFQFRSLVPESYLLRFGQALPPVSEPRDGRPDWAQADPGWIREALKHSQERASGGWYVLHETRALSSTPESFMVAGRSLVVWRDHGQTFVAPEACPHMGASLAGARVCEGRLVCPWHGLQLSTVGQRGWKTFRTYDDGLLSWVQLPGEDAELTSAPVITTRPAGAVSAVMRVEAECEPRDVIQNRLDPWHGAHYHPHSFAALRVLEKSPEDILVRVAVRLLGPVTIEVDARFHCPDRRSIVMTIVEGEGKGSVVETHATPISAGRTAIIEATLAHSERPGFRGARLLQPALRPVMRWAAQRLWEEDAAYAERLYALRNQTARRVRLELQRPLRQSGTGGGVGLHRLNK